MTLSLSSPPQGEPVTLDDAKDFLRVDDASEDTLISSLITSARLLVEAQTGKALISQGWTLFVNSHPQREIIIPISPVQSIQSVKISTQGSSPADAPYTHRIEGGEAQILLSSIPLPDSRIAIAFTAGYAAGDAPEDVPAPLRQAILHLAAHWFENRGDARSAPAPQSVSALISPYRRARL